jgi:hypothetical protein
MGEPYVPRAPPPPLRGHHLHYLRKVARFYSSNKKQVVFYFFYLKGKEKGKEREIISVGSQSMYQES